MTRQDVLLECVIIMVAMKKPPTSTIYPAQKGMELSHPQSSAPPVNKIQFIVEHTWPFRERASGQNGRLNPLRMGITTEGGVLFDSHLRHKNKALQLDITTVNPSASSNLEHTARYTGKNLANAVKRKKNKYRGSFPTAYFFLPFAMSTCCKADSDMHVLIKELVIKWVEHRSKMYSNEPQYLERGRK